MNNLSKKTEVRCIVCEHVFLSNRDVLRVFRFSDGEIQCDCGDISHDADGEYYKDFKIIGINHLVDRDLTLNSIFEFELNHVFFREKIGEEWTSEILPEGE